MSRFLKLHYRLLVTGLMSMLFFMTVKAGNDKPRPEYYEIKIYHLKTAEQEKTVDAYLQQAYLPALHKSGIKTVGVFKPLANDTAADKLIYLFIPYKSLDQFLALPGLLDKDAAYESAGATYLNAPYSNPPYTRMESIVLRAFRLAPLMQMPKLTGSNADHIYELRSYEGPTEKLYANKVHMFNEGGEIPLFARLGFNAVFYADVISGSKMPNLMYLTSFNDMSTHDQKWKDFGADPEWKKLVAMPEYQHNVSKADIILMHAAAYSDL